MCPFCTIESSPLSGGHFGSVSHLSLDLGFARNRRVELILER